MSFVSGKRSLGALRIIVVTVALFFLFAPEADSRLPDNAKIIESVESLYHSITIGEYIESDTEHRIRCMTFAGRTPTSQSCIDLDDQHRQVLEYTGMVFAGLLYQPQPKRVLIVGLGGGIIPMIFADLFPQAKVDVVEIDKAVEELAKKHFRFNPTSNVSVHIMDGRRFIRRVKNRYDLIVLDAFTGDHIPFHLMTQEFLEELKGKALTKDGVLVSNVFFSDKLFSRQYSTYDDAFANLHSFSGKRSGNVILIATDKPGGHSAVELAKNAKAMQKEDGYPYFDLSVLASQYDRGLGRNPEARPLTDDFAPVNYLQKKR